MGYEPKTEFKDGLKRVHQWFLENWENIRKSADFGWFQAREYRARWRALARLSKIARMSPQLWLVKVTCLFENVMEKTPGINYLNSNIIVIGAIKRALL